MYICSRSTPYDRSIEKKRIDDYATSKRDDYKRDSFKRPATDYTAKRDIDPPRHTNSSNSYDNSRSAPVHRNDTINSTSSSGKDRYGIAQSSDSRAVNSFPASRGGGGGGGGGGRDDSRDSRYVGQTTPSWSQKAPPANRSSDPRAINNVSKSRYMDGGSGSASDGRYAPDRNSSTTWPNAGPPAVKTFNHMQSVAGNDPWGQKQSDSSWRSMEQGQDRYDRTYNERKSQTGPSQYIDPSRQNSFVGGRPQDRYNNPISSRFENGSRF